jgi:dihydrofolate synthase/folylpolyglutamate synthase
MTYAEALSYLASLEPLGIRPGLDRIRALLARLGDPQREFPSVLIAGTNGKGSVTAFLAAILREAGIRPGVYTSPHLVRFEERVAVGAETVAEEEVATLTAEVREAIEAVRAAGAETPTYFEATTALAFLHFARRRVPIALLEVGMGGRFDATNVVDPLACAITPVAMDHMQWLGGTLAEIAFQKAGILRSGVPAAIGSQAPEALAVIRDEAGRLGAPLRLAADCLIQPAGGGSLRPAGGGPGGRGRFPDPPVFSLSTPSGRRHPDLRLSLRGDHQADNATVAVLLAERLAKRGFGRIDDGAIARGLAGATWPGRIEIVPGRPEVLLDGAHNPAGCETLAAYLRDHRPGRRVALLFAAMKDKPAEEMLRILSPLAQEVVVTGLAVARGESPARLHDLALRLQPRAARADSVPIAFEAARRAAGPEGLCVVSGSLYLVGEIKTLLAPDKARA